MRKLNLSREILLAAALLGCVCSLRAQALRTLTRVEAEDAIKRADRALLPGQPAEVAFDRKQAMLVKGSSNLVLLPVRFAAPNPGGGSAPFFECGFFLLPRGKPATFLPTFGLDFTETESCNSLQAIGAAVHTTDASGLPPLALIYMGFTLRDSYPEPILLQPQGEGYTVDAERSQWLGQQKDGRTVAGIRRLLARHIQKDSPRKTASPDKL